jgi:hypothetical protein
MFGFPYKFNFLGTSQRFGSKNLVSQSKYRFVAKHRKYFVVADHFDFNLIGIKYCDNKDRDSRNAYTKIFNEKDSDASRVIATCISIMHSLWRENPFISFGFYATPRTMDINTIVSKKKFKDAAALNNYVERQKRTRFLIYEHAMINLFSPKNFLSLKITITHFISCFIKKLQKGKLTEKRNIKLK